MNEDQIEELKTMLNNFKSEEYLNDLWYDDFGLRDGIKYTVKTIEEYIDECIEDNK